VGGAVVQPPDIFPPCGIEYKLFFIPFSPRFPGGEKNTPPPPDICLALRESPTGTELATQRLVSPHIHRLYYDYYRYIKLTYTEYHIENISPAKRPINKSRVPSDFSGSMPGGLFRSYVWLVGRSFNRTHGETPAIAALIILTAWLTSG